jgi:hypothetical protein
VSKYVQIAPRLQRKRSFAPSGGHETDMDRSGRNANVLLASEEIDSRQSSRPSVANESSVKDGPTGSSGCGLAYTARVSRRRAEYSP